MEQTKIICISCPKGCPVLVLHEGSDVKEVTGHSCASGKTYAQNEFTNPVRVLTSTVRVDGGELALLPVKTKEPVPKGMMFDCMQDICRIVVKAPVKIGTVLRENIGGTGVDLIACRDLRRL